MMWGVIFFISIDVCSSMHGYLMFDEQIMFSINVCKFLFLKKNNIKEVVNSVEFP